MEATERVRLLENAIRMANKCLEDAEGINILYSLELCNETEYVQLIKDVLSGVGSQKI